MSHTRYPKAFPDRQLREIRKINTKIRQLEEAAFNETRVIRRSTSVNAESLQIHIDAANPHPQYATDTDLADHVAAADPHTQYREEEVVGFPTVITGVRRVPVGYQLIVWGAYTLDGGSLTVEGEVVIL